MPDTVYIVGTDKTDFEYLEKLITLIKAEGVNAMSCTFEEYNNMTSLSDIVFDGAKFIFFGANSLGKSKIPNFSTWQYERFGCRIGWVGNKCVIFAKSTDLPYCDYNDFRNYCKSLQIIYQDVVIPPESPVAEGIEWVKKLLSNKKNRSAHRAQYSTLVYEFMNNYLVSFLTSGDDSEEIVTDIRTPQDIKDILRQLKKLALVNLSTKQAVLCHAIIHASALGCATVAFIPIPVADTFPITAAQVSMVLALGKVFDNKLTKSDAQVLLKTVAAPLAGRALAKAGLVLIPGVGWAINGVIAGTITEILGWTIANDFATKSKMTDSLNETLRESEPNALVMNSKNMDKYE